jgi:FK506-binding protein 2
MRFQSSPIIVALLSTLSLVAASTPVPVAADKLQIGVKYVPDECPLKAQKGDKLSMQ